MKTPNYFLELMNRFKQEAKLLFRLSHPGIVRVYNYFDYPESDTAFILMEMIDGLNIIEYLATNPTHIERLLEEAVEAFIHLEKKGILHRDIRPDNILVDAEGKLKVIDFGFGKDLTQQANSSGKSIYLNWWCQIPEDFGNGIYDATTEVYFVGMLFEKIIRDGKLTDSRHMDVIKRMSQFERADRLPSFAKVAAEIASTPEQNIEFTQRERSSYQDFSASLDELIASISEGANYESDPDKILEGLRKLYEKTMLEPHIPEPSHLVRIFVLGTYRYYPSEEFSTALLKDFTDIIGSASGQKRSILLTNIRSKLDAIRRTPIDLDEEIPF